MTLAPVAWVYAAEVWSLETRAVGMVLFTVDQRFSIHDYATFYPTEYRSDRELAI